MVITLYVLHLVLITAQPQMQQLYGGRMTVSRQQEVSSTIKDAIEKLHK